MKILKPIPACITKALFVLVFPFFCSIVVKAQTPTITFSLVHQPCNAGGVADGILRIDVTGMSYPIYLFTSYNGFDTLTASNPFMTINNYSGVQMDVYAYGGTQNLYSTFSSPPFVIKASATDAICPNLTGKLSAAITGGTSPYSINWYAFSDHTHSAVLASGSPVNLPPGNYTMDVTDAAGCYFDKHFYLDSIAGPFGVMYFWDSIVINNVSNIYGSLNLTSANCTNGTASIVNVGGGIAPYTYQWNTGSHNDSIGNLSNGSYSVTVTDSQGCHQDFSGWVQQVINLYDSVVTTPATCLNTDGSAMAFVSGGTPPYSFMWSNGVTGQTLSNISEGWYEFFVTDVNGCTGMGWANIISSTPITVTYTQTPTQCTQPDGTATLSINGGQAPYQVNWSTFPIQNGITATGLDEGYTYFNITDVNGCVRNGNVYVYPASNLWGTVSATPEHCPAHNGTATINAYTNAPPVTYLWNTGATTQTIHNLSAGWYSCIISDASGCSKTKWVFVETISPVHVGFSTTDASCLFTNDGSIVAHVTGGSPPYSYSWFDSGINNDTLVNLYPSDYYYYYNYNYYFYHDKYRLWVTDTNGCRGEGFVHLGYDETNDSCYCTISGYAYEDVNTNCVRDSGETGLNHVRIGCSGGFGYTWTDATGFYSFKVPTGSYIISENPLGIVNLAPCQNNNQVVNATATSGCVIPINFGNTLDQVHDVRIRTINSRYAVVGNPYAQFTLISNEGTHTENNIQLGYAHDGQLLFQNPSPLSYTQQNAVSFPNWFSDVSGFPSLNPWQSILNRNNFYVPTNIPLGTEVILKDTLAYAPPMTNWLNENSPWNNVEYYQVIVVGSFDPNYVDVTPRGFGPQGQINFSDTILDYEIHFQNTGTYPAQLIVVTDSLDTDLDWNTLKPGWSNHNYVATLSEHGILTFRFNNINLAVGNSPTDFNSIGIVTYSIEAKNNLPVLTQIKNSANIYFDYNAPVATNTTVNTYVTDVGVKETSRDNSLEIYPNPAGENVMLAFENSNDESVFVELYDISGKQLIAQKYAVSAGKNFINMDLHSLSSGLYILKLRNSSGEKTKKISVIR